VSLVVDIIKLPFKAAKKGVDVASQQVKKQLPEQPEKENLKQYFIFDMSSLLTSYGFKIDDAIKISQDFYNLNKDKIRDVLAIF